SEFEAEQRQSIADFAIRDPGSGSRRGFAGEMAEYYPVTYVEPLRHNEAAIGFDLASDPVRRVAIQSAVRTGAVTVTEPITLIQDPADSSDVLLTLAVSSQSNGAGLLLFVLHIDKCVEAQLGPAKQMLSVQLVDQQTNQVLFRSPSGISPVEHYGRTIR